MPIIQEEATVNRRPSIVLEEAEEDNNDKFDSKSKGKSKVEQLMGSGETSKERESKIKKFTGLDRCVKCVTKEIRCVVDISVIEKWECDVAAGKKFSKAPAGAACDECHAKKHKCLLPRTEQLRQGFMDRKKRSDTVARDLPETKRLQAVEEGWVEFVVNKGAEFVEMVREHEEVEKEITLKHARIADALERVIVAIEEDKPYISPVEWTSSGSEED